MPDHADLVRSADYYLAAYGHLQPDTTERKVARAIAQGVLALTPASDSALRAATLRVVAVLFGLPAMTSFSGVGLPRESYLVPAADIRALRDALGGA